MVYIPNYVNKFQIKWLKKLLELSEENIILCSAMRSSGGSILALGTIISSYEEENRVLQNIELPFDEYPIICDISNCIGSR